VNGGKRDVKATGTNHLVAGEADKFVDCREYGSNPGRDIRIGNRSRLLVINRTTDEKLVIQTQFAVTRLIVLVVATGASLT